MSIRLVRAHPGHIRLVAAQLRERDRQEIQAGWGEPEQAMLTCLANSPRYARMAFYEMEPLALFGISPLTVLGEASQVWCFGTCGIDRHRLAFARASRNHVLPELFQYARLLTNLVDLSDTRALAWLTFLGGSFVLRAERRGGKLFGQFVLTQSQGVSTCQQA